MSEAHPIIELQFSGTAQWIAFTEAQRHGYTSCVSQAWSSDAVLPLQHGTVLWEDIRPSLDDHDVVFKDDISITSVCRDRRNFKCIVYATTSAQALDKMRRLQELLRPAARTNKLLDVTFWYWTQHGPRRYDRQLHAPTWEEIARNYPSATRERLIELKSVEPTEGAGKLILWQGEPGTGKTFALRALGEEWASWCRMHYVLDPERFFTEGDYLLNVILEENAVASIGPEEKKPEWRLIVLEDAGEMLAKDAKLQVGQGLARLLNLCDGLLGQGLRVLVLITTNEQVGTLHAAVSRPGRCLSQIVFEKFDTNGANHWLREHGSDLSVVSSSSVADLYALINGGRVPERKVAGFARIT